MRAVAARPDRRPGKFEDEELEIMRMGNDGTRQEVVKYRTEQREYGAPFNYPNFHVELGRLARTKEGGAEYNMDGVEIDVPPWGAITFRGRRADYRRGGDRQLMLASPGPSSCTASLSSGYTRAPV